MEIWDLYTENREKTGKTHIRGFQIPKGCYHLVVHVWIKNKKGEYLISQRAADRPTCPLMFECVGGSVLAGESSIDGAVREVKEEVGLNLNPADGKLIFSEIRDEVNGKPYQNILDVWMFEYDGELQLDKATTNEVAACQWMSVGEIKKLCDDGKLVDSLYYFFSTFDV